MSDVSDVSDANDQQTCGPKFSAALSYFARITQDPVQLFSAGHMTGQAEKVYLGACTAAMFRPSLEYSAWAFQAAVYLAGLYGLSVSTFGREDIADEIWIHRTNRTENVQNIQFEDFNSSAWHILRGMLCGVPIGEIDTEFHLRKGYAKPCDRLEEEKDAKRD